MMEQGSSSVKPKISMIITCYNLEEYITRAISSCLNQTLDECFCEVVVVDDCSTDGSWKQIQGFGSLITSVRLETNGGVSCSSNVGIHLSRGKYITRVDGDDFINRNFAHSMCEVLDWNDDVGFVYCDHIRVDEEGQRQVEINTLDRLLDHGAGVVFRRRYMDALGLYDESLRNREDYDFISRYIKNFDGYHLKLPYYRYFKRAGSLSTMVDERLRLKEKIDERA